MSWSLFKEILNQGINSLLYLVLAAFLSAADFGLLTALTIFLTFYSFASEIGINSTIVQRPGLKKETIDSLYSLNSLIQGLLFLLMIPIGWLYARYYDSSSIVDQYLWASVGIMAFNFAGVHRGMMMRRLAFRQILMIQLIANMMAAVVALVMTYDHVSIWTYTIFSLVKYAVDGILTIIYANRAYGRVVFAKMMLRENADELKYTRKILYFNITKFFAQNIDKLVVGSFLGTAALGGYNFLSKLITYPVTIVTGGFGAALLPLYSRNAGDESIIDHTRTFFIFSFAVLIPFLVFLSFNLDFIMLQIIGDKFLSVYGAIYLFGIVSVIRILLAPFGHLLKALDRVNTLNLLTFLRPVTFLLIVVVLDLHDVGSILWVMVFVEFAFLAALAIYTNRMIRSFIAGSMMSLMPLFLITAVLVGLNFAAMNFFPEHDMKFIIVSAIFIIMYMLAVNKKYDLIQKITHDFKF